MEEGKSHVMFQNSWFRYQDRMKNDDRSASSTSSSIGEDSKDSFGSNISSDASDTADDASSPASSGRVSYDLSGIMAQLPIKRGLSKFYQGKSESFTSLERVTSIEDLAKKTSPIPYRRRNLKACRSYGTGLNSSSIYRLHTLSKPVISKKATRGSSFSSFSSKRGSFMGNKKPQPTPLQEDLQC